MSSGQAARRRVIIKRSYTVSQCVMLPLQETRIKVIIPPVGWFQDTIPWTLNLNPSVVITYSGVRSTSLKCWHSRGHDTARLERECRGDSKYAGVRCDRDP